jgi:hypothetical protein
MSLPPRRLFAADRPSGDDPAVGSADGERELRAAVPVFVNSFNQLTYLRDTLEWLRANGFRNVCVVDQNSSYPPLLAFYESGTFASQARLWRLGENIGPRSAIDGAPLVRWAVPHIFTDPDLALPDPPDQSFLTRLFALSRQYRVHKVGLALDISEPEAFHDRKVSSEETGGPVSIIEWERQFWRTALEPDVYRANVDTTFHLFNPAPGLDWRNVRRKLQDRPLKIRCLRVAGAGFVARHRPWYRDDGQTADERRFYASISAPWSNWALDADRAEDAAFAEAPPTDQAAPDVAQSNRAR